MFAIVSAVIGYCAKIYFTFQANMVGYQNLITQSMYDKQLDSRKGTLLHLCDDVIQQEVKEVILSFLILMEQGNIVSPFNYIFQNFNMMNFLSNILREEGGFEYKKAIVDLIVTIIRDIPDAKEGGLLQISEFIEDCEFTYLSTQILHFLGIEGPKTSDPSKFIRYIYNRIILKNATVRASAVSTLAKFGAMVDSLMVTLTLFLLGQISGKSE